MTIRNAFENCLIELNKVLAPSLLVDDFIYLFNKSIQQYVNKRYNLFETKQQLTDDLRVLTRTVKIDLNEPISELGTSLILEDSVNVFGKSYRCKLPNDYVHMLNCICEFNNENAHCPEDVTIQQGANKLDTSQWSHVINNYYMRPSAKRPYYYIINIEDPEDHKNGISDDIKKYDFRNSDGSLTDKYKEGTRYGNSVLPIMLIKCGTADLRAVYIDYLRAPEYVTMDQDILDDIEDNSQVLEFPDYVVYEIINEIVKLILENGFNQRVLTNPAVTQTIQ